MAREAEVVGPIPEHRRVNFDSTGGAFDGSKCDGSIVPGDGNCPTISANGVGVLDVREDDALTYVASSGILALAAQDLAAGTASVATLDRKGAVTSNRRRSRLGFPCEPRETRHRCATVLAPIE